MPRAAAFLLLLALSGCGTPAPTPEPAPSPAQTETRPRYLPYSPRMVDSRRGAMLFFVKDSDPYSVEHDHLLESLYESGSVSVSTYRVDFGSATGARLKYGVIVEDTFILLDASGERVGAFTHPSTADIHVLVQGRVPAPPSP